MEKMFTEMLNQMYRWMQYAQNFMEKTFYGWLFNHEICESKFPATWYHAIALSTFVYTQHQFLQLLQCGMLINMPYYQDYMYKPF